MKTTTLLITSLSLLFTIGCESIIGSDDGSDECVVVHDFCDRINSVYPDGWEDDSTCYAIVINIDDCGSKIPEVIIEPVSDP